MSWDIVLIDPRPALSRPGPSLGLASIEAYLTARGYSLAVICPAQLEEYQDSAEVFGITTMDHTYMSARRISARLKERTVIWGGWTSTALPEVVLRENRGVDYVILREGERRLHDLLVCRASGASVPDQLDGIAYRNEGESVTVRPPVGYQNLDDLPMATNADLVVSGDYVLLEIARGCHGRCGYCQEDHRMRFKSAARVAEEMQYWYDLGHRSFCLGGANSLANGPQLRELVRQIETRGLQSRLAFLGHPRDILRNREALLELFSSKVSSVCSLEIGMEAASRNALNLLGRRSTPEMNREALAVLLDLKRRHSPETAVHANMILFSHFDMTMDDFVENVRFIGEFDCSREVMSLQLYGIAGTPIWDAMISRGFRGQPERGLQICDYPFTDGDVDRLFSKLVRDPTALLMVTGRYNMINQHKLQREVYDRILGWGRSEDPRARIMEWLR